MKMVLYRPRFRYQDKAAKPPNLAEAEGIASPCKAALPLFLPPGIF